MGSGWRRRFRFVIPVRNAEHWGQASIVDLLREALSFLSDDDYEFEFEKATKPPLLESYLELGGEDLTAFQANEVLLFSGGLDSLAGAVEELSTGRKKVALVSHRSSPKIYDHQKRLVDELKRKFRGMLMHFPVQITKHGMRAHENTQRSRSFLYAAIACVVAHLFGNKRIRFFENGVVSINLPISEQVVGARATRTTYPLVLERFRAFFSATVGRSIEVDNPFIWKTKADVVRTIVELGCAPLIKNTVSCTRTYEATTLQTHCGCCSQCIDRRFGILAAGAADHDPVEKYKVELLKGERNRPEHLTMAELYVRTALEFCGMGELAFFGRFGGEAARACDGFPSLKPDDVARQILRLHRRHGQTISEVMRTAVESNGAELVHGRIPRSSLLLMTLSRGPVPTLSKISGRLDPLLSLTDTEADAPPAAAEAMETLVGPRSAAHRASRKSSPSLERALRAIFEIFPKGVPDQATVPNAILLRRVGENLRKAGLPSTSNDTILRAAGRRK